MQHQSLKNNTGLYKDALALVSNIAAGFFPENQQAGLFEDQRFSLYNLLKRLAVPMGKKNFLVFKQHKYINVPTDSIAFFYVKYETVMIVGFDKKEYAINYSLEQVQELLGDQQFFRINRQYLISFSSVKEVEHYFARKLLVTLTVPVLDKLLVSKEKASAFLHWLENR